MRNSARGWLAHGLAAAVLAVVSVVFRGNDYVLTIAIFSLLYGLLAMGTSLLMGHAGQVTLGQGGFFAIGAYTSALLTLRVGFPIWGGLAGAIITSVVGGYALGIPVLRLRGHYLGLVTLSFTQLIHEIALIWPSLTGGVNGITGIPRPSLGPMVIDTLDRYYLLVLIIWMLGFIAAQNIISSRFGRALHAVKFSEWGAQAAGVDVARYKSHAFALSAAYMGVAGGLYAHFMRYIGPESFTLEISITVLAMCILGGMTDVRGAVLGSILLTVLQEPVRQYPEYQPLIYALVIIITTIFMPGGLMTTIERWLHHSLERTPAPSVAQADDPTLSRRK